MTLITKDELAAVIPFFNEKGTIAEIVNNTLKYVSVLIVVNDGSTDGSELLVPADSRIILLNRSVNRGKGYSLNEGLRRCSLLGIKFVITLDADLQHPPEMIPAIAEKLKYFDIVIGARSRNVGEMPWHRKLSNVLTSFLVRLKTGIKINDSQSGFRAYRLESIMSILPQSDGYEAETEILIDGSRQGLLIGEVPIPTIYNEIPSKMNYFSATIGFIRVILK